MGWRRKLITGLCGAEVLLAAFSLIAPLTFFPVCEAPMHCNFSFKAEAALCLVVAAAAAATWASKGAEAARMLSVVTAVCGVFMVLFPSYLFGVCASPAMACHNGLLPLWNIAGGGVVLISACVFVFAREERDD